MTLTKVAQFTRLLITFSLIFFAIGVTSFIGYKIWHAKYLASLPPVEEKPNPIFGILKQPNLPQTDVSSSNYTYSIDTVDGNLPQFGKLIKVFIIPPVSASFLSGDKSKDLAQKFNLTTIPQILSETEYKFSDTNASLLINLDSGNFSYTKEASSSATDAIAATNDELIRSFKDNLTSLGILKNELKNGRVTVNKSADLKEATISIWPEDIDGKPILTPQKDVSFVNARVNSNAIDLANYLSIDFTFWMVDTSSFATYPLKTSSEALNDLKSGKGAVIATPPKPQVSITKVDLGYFENLSYFPYLEPIYIFSGPQFSAYVTAVSNQYLIQK